MRFVGRSITAVLLATLVLGPIGPADAQASRRPSAPRSVRAVPLDAAVRLTWAAPASKGGSRIDRYAIQRRTSTTAVWVTVKKVPGYARAWTSTGLHNGRRYYFRVRAHNGSGLGIASVQVSAVPRVTPPPAAPTPSTPIGLTGAVQHDDSGYPVKLDWSAPANAASAPVLSYTIQRALGAGPFGTIGTTSSLTYADTTAAVDTAYTYRVIPVGAAGAGSPSVVPVSTRLVTITETTVEVNEGSTTTFHVTLAYVPTTDTAITITSSDPGAAIVLNGGVTIPAGSTNGTVTIQGTDDADTLGEALTMIAELGPSEATVNVTVHDDDVI